MTFKDAWENKIDEETVPLYMNNLVEYEFDDFKEKILNPTDEFIDKITSSLYSGDVYVIRNTLSKDTIEGIKEKVFNLGNTTPTSFSKIIEGAPNFHRKIDLETSKKYTYRANWHQHTFFRWNDDQFGLFKIADKYWPLLKILSGYSKDDFINNTPKDILVDRLFVNQYPRGGGFLEVHSDPYQTMKTIMCVKMSEKGVDYTEGGLYFLNKEKEKINVEDKINIGDLYFSFPWVSHGIDPVDPDDKQVQWNNHKGRWLFLLSTLESNEVNEKLRSKMGFSR